MTFKPKYDILSDKKSIVNELISISKKVKSSLLLLKKSISALQSPNCKL